MGRILICADVVILDLRGDAEVAADPDAVALIMAGNEIPKCGELAADDAAGCVHNTDATLPMISQRSRSCGVEPDVVVLDQVAVAGSNDEDAVRFLPRNDVASQ